ncbi:hypothetical protein Pmani_005254 [Petrolisthes manimaculis]|uniref:Uncharacterized protein n=1 Tax=Petrolisthes manimaculis TaxID=1843537 RepID=A0AAE1UKR1_9EUCA|nr:hypothetical protein Pmani_005254 [Petrolisthes manimaculis]
MYSWVKKKVFAQKDASDSSCLEEEDDNADSECKYDPEKEGVGDRYKVRKVYDHGASPMKELSFLIPNDTDLNNINFEKDSGDKMNGEFVNDTNGVSEYDSEGKSNGMEGDSSGEAETENDNGKSVQSGTPVDNFGLPREAEGLPNVSAQQEEGLCTVSSAKDGSRMRNNLPSDISMMSLEDDEVEKVVMHNTLEKKKSTGPESQESLAITKIDVPVEIKQVMFIQEENSVKNSHTAPQDKKGIAKSNLVTQENTTLEDESHRRDYVGRKKKRLARGTAENGECNLSTPFVKFTHSSTSSSSSYSRHSCLYNQTGRMSTVLGERFILAHIDGVQQIVNTKLEESTVGPFGVAIVWNGVKPKALKKVIDGEEVQFDAVLFPRSSKLIALVVWQEVKPIYSIEPYFKSSVILERFEGLTVKLVSLDKEKGRVSTFIHGKFQSVVFSLSDVFLHGKQVSDVKRLSRFINSDAFLGNICVFVTASTGSFVQYEYICSCLWLGVKPQEGQSSSDIDRFSLHRVSLNSYEVSKEQFLMHCDASTKLVIKDGVCSLEYEEGDRVITIPCRSEFMYCGKRCVVPVLCGEVTAHVRKVVDKKGKEEWSAVLVQVDEELLNPPQVYKNCQGTLQFTHNHFNITANLNGVPTLLKIGNEALLVVDGVLTKPEKNMANIEVQFDVSFVRNKVCHIVPLWRGEKPAWYEHEGSKYYFDVPGVYQGFDEQNMQFAVTLDGEKKTIKIKPIKGMYNKVGHQCTSLPLLSFVSLHLKEVLCSGEWKAIQFVVMTPESTAMLSPIVPAMQVEAKLCTSTHKAILPPDLKHIARRGEDVSFLAGIAQQSTSTQNRPFRRESGPKKTSKQDANNVVIPSNYVTPSQHCSSDLTAPSNTVGILHKNKSTCTLAPCPGDSSQLSHVTQTTQFVRDSSQNTITDDLPTGFGNGAQNGISSNKQVMNNVQALVKENLNEILVRSLGSSSIGNQKYLTNHNQFAEAGGMNTNKTSIEDLQCQEIYLIFAGKINMSSTNYVFTYTHDGYSRSIPLPQDIAMDSPLSISSLLMDFYLLVNKRDVCHPVCGWFEKRNRQLLTKEYQVLHSYNPEENLLTLLDQSGCLDYFQFDGQYLVVCNSRHLVRERSSRGQLVHAVLEEVESCNIKDHEVNKKVLFLTSNTYIYQISLKFLSLSLTDNQYAMDSFIAHQTTGLQLASREGSHSCTYTSPDTGISSCKNKIQLVLQNDARKVPVTERNNQQTSAATPDLMDVEHAECSSSLGMNKDSSSITTENKNIAEDRSFLCRKTLRNILAKGYLDNLTKKHAKSYPVLLGVVYETMSISSFYCSYLRQALSLPSGVPRFDWKRSKMNTMSYLLVQKKLTSGTVSFHPRFLWPKGAVCDPYIICTQQLFLVDTKYRVLGLQDEATDSAKKFMYCYDVTYTQNRERTIKDFIKDVKGPYFAVVEDVSPKIVEGNLIEGEILFLTSSYCMAVACVSTVVGNSTGQILYS